MTTHQSKGIDPVAVWMESLGFHWLRRTEYGQEFEYYVSNNNEDWILPADLAAHFYKLMLRERLEAVRELSRELHAAPKDSWYGTMAESQLRHEAQLVEVEGKADPTIELPDQSLPIKEAQVTTDVSKVMEVLKSVSDEGKQDA